MSSASSGDQSPIHPVIPTANSSVVPAPAQTLIQGVRVVDAFNESNRTEPRTVDGVLADLDRLRDHRSANLVTEGVYHEEEEGLWEELREIDRRNSQRREAEEQIAREAARQLRRDQKIARSQERLAALLAEPPRHTSDAARKWLEAFTKIDSTNQPDLRARQRRVEERLMRLARGEPSPGPTGRFRLSEYERGGRRAESSGDAGNAVEIARRFHKFVKRLYVSRRAEIQYGRGGGQVKVWPRTYSSGGFPKVWKNAGVWIDYAAGQIVFENHKGEVKSRLPLPPMKLVTFDGLEDGDLWGIVRPDVAQLVERWGLGAGGITVVRGYAER